MQYTYFGAPTAQGREAALDYVSELVDAVAAHFGISRSEILSASRQHQHWKPRMAAMYCARNLTPCSLPELGRLFGGRSHTTVLRAVERCRALMESDEGWAARMEKLMASLRAARLIGVS